MKMKVILVNFQNEYLSKKGKWFSKSKITKFITSRFIPFCDRHNLSIYEIKSDYSTPNMINQNGCVPGTFGFKSLIEEGKLAAKPFIKSDNSPNFIRPNHGDNPVEKPEEFKHWLDENIGDPSQIAYVLLLGIGLESSITMIGHEMAKYGYKIKILKEGTDTTNKKYTEFMLDKFPLVSWGKVINFVNFVKELKKYSKIVPVESNWRPSPYPPVGQTSSQESYNTESIFEEEPQPDPIPTVTPAKEVLKESEKRPINIMTTDPNANISKADTIAMMKSQMKAQYHQSEEITPKAEPAIEFSPAEEKEEISVQATPRPAEKVNQADAARRRVEEYYKKMFGEDPTTEEDVAPLVEPEPVVEPEQDITTIVQPEPIVTEPVVQQPVQPEVVPETPKIVEPIIVQPQPIVQEVKVKSTRPSPSKEKYAYIFDSMIYIENQMYKDRPKETTPANFIKSTIINGDVGTRKNVKPKTQNINKISVHEKYALMDAKKRRDNAIEGIKYKPSNGKADSNNTGKK